MPSLNLIYESCCKICNPLSSQQEAHGQSSRSIEGIYMGEISRSLHEHAVEHWKDAESFSSKFHIVKTESLLFLTSQMEVKITYMFRDCLSSR